MDAQENALRQNQALQQQMVEQANQIAGVAEAMAAYNRLAPYTTIVLNTPQTTMRITYSNGGNQGANA